MGRAYSGYATLIIFSLRRKSALLRRWLVASRQSRGADWFAPALFRSRALVHSMKKHEIMVLACQVGPFHLTLTQINSEMNCIAKNKCPDSQKLDTRRRGENSFSLIYSMWGNKRYRKSYFHSETKSYSVECLCYYWNATDRWFNLIRFNILTSSHNL